MRLHVHLPFDSSAAYGASWANAVDAATKEISAAGKGLLFFFLNKLYVTLMTVAVEESCFCFWY